MYFNTHTYIHMCVCIHIYIYPSIYMYIYINKNNYIDIYIHIYTTRSRTSPQGKACASTLSLRTRSTPYALSTILPLGCQAAWAKSSAMRPKLVRNPRRMPRRPQLHGGQAAFGTARREVRPRGRPTRPTKLGMTKGGNDISHIDGAGWRSTDTLQRLPRSGRSSGRQLSGVVRVPGEA